MPSLLFIIKQLLNLLSMFGNNTILGLESGDGHVLRVNSIFLTIQGEGEFTGIPSIFIRLSGCNLACKFCDTEFDTFEEMHLNTILDTVLALNFGKNVKVVTITGGEPFRHPLEKLCQSLLECGFQPQIETNGTLFRDVPEQVSIVCSPKPTKNGYRQIRPDLVKRITSFKFLISKFHEYYDSVPEVGQSIYNTKVFIQPIDEYDNDKNVQNIRYAIEVAQKYGYRLSIQIHKILGIE